MAGTKAGAMKAKETNLKRYGKDFYKTIGKRGGENGHGMKGFALDKERASRAGRIGGKKSKRTPAKKSVDIKTEA